MESVIRLLKRELKSKKKHLKFLQSNSIVTIENPLIKELSKQIEEFEKALVMIIKD